jgi:hypothetical protein
MAAGTSTNAPKREIRRFDVFAEYNRIKGLENKGLDAAHAKGYGLWVAKVVASGGSRRTSTRRQHGGAEEHAEQQAEPGTQGNHGKQEWHELSGEPQTDDLFDHEIVERMGKGFYTHVFSPAIRQAIAQDRSYESIRDAIRKDWKPTR